MKPLVLKVTDIKQYVYCPRIVYFTYVQPVEHRFTAKMHFGKEAHANLDRLEKRRTFASYPELATGERIFHTYLFSPRLGLEGRLDVYLIQEGEVFPVEFKSTARGPRLNHKYQLTAYAMLLEEKYHKPVRKGFIKLVNPLSEGGGRRENTIPVEITVSMRQFVKEMLQRIRLIITSETLPQVRWRKNCCGNCEYQMYCRDLG